MVIDLSQEPLLNTSTGAYHFDPFLMMQARGGDVRNAAMNPSLLHERAHWLQFAGATFGGMYMTLMQAEDLTLKGLYQSNAMSRKFRDYVAERLTTGQPVLPIAHVMEDPGIEDSVPEGARSFFRRISTSRLFRRLMFDARGGWPRFRVVKFDKILDSTFEILGRHFDTHVPGWPGRTDPGIPILGAPRPRPVALRGVGMKAAPGMDGLTAEFTEYELTTSMLLEAGAALSEISLECPDDWRLGAGRIDPLSADQSRHISDVIGHLGADYSLPLDYAIASWYESFSAVEAADISNSLMAAMPTIACCIDIALNPWVPPSSPWKPQIWEEFYPPARFVRVVESVGKVGLFSSTVSAHRDTAEHEYHAYRQRLSSRAGLSMPPFSGRSERRVPIDGEFLVATSPAHEMLMNMTHCDYLIWAMESVRLVRERYPLKTALPFFLFTDGNVQMHLMAEGLRIALSAPLYRAGSTGGYQHELSSQASYKILVEVCTAWALAKISYRGGLADLAFVVPDADEGLVENVRHFLVGYTDCPELAELVVSTAVDGHAESTAVELRLSTELLREVPVTRADVEALKISPLLAMFESLRSDGLRSMRTFGFSFSGYHQTDRELWEIPEVMNFVKLLGESAPYWPWYVYLDSDTRNCFGAVLLFHAGLGSSSLSAVEQRIDRVLVDLRGEGRRVGAPAEIVEAVCKDFEDVIRATIPTTLLWE